jgi:hypothetical protein
VKIIKLSELPEGLNSAEFIIDYMLDNGYKILINDNTSTNMEYAIDDIHDSYKFLEIHYRYLKNI